MCLFTANSLIAGGTVTNATFAQLQQALSGGGEVLFSVGGSITFTGPVSIQTNTLIDGGSRTVTFDGNDSYRLFNVSTGATLTLRNLTFTRGAHKGTNGVAGADGSDGASNGQNGKPGTDGEGASGGVVFNAGSLIAVNCSFLTNSASGGDGGDGGNGGNGDLTGGNGGDAGSGGAASGGAIYNLGSLLLTNCFFSDNEANGGFGGVGGTNGAGTFASHPGHGGKGGLAWGGAVYNAGTASVFNTTLVFNVATGGDSSNGGSSDDSAVGLDGRNGAEARGGAIHNVGTLTLVNSTLANGDAIGGNAGDGGPGTFTGGDGGDGGHAIGGNLCNDGTVAITNVTFSGGGVTPGEHGSPGSGGLDGADGEKRGGNLANMGTLMLINTIIADPFRGKNGYGSVVDLGHNLSSDDTPNLKAVGSLKKTDPLLDDLKANGGYASTLALLTNSPAIDAGDSSVGLAIDQRGAARPGGSAIDIGAFEFGQALYSISGRLLEGSNGISGFTVTAAGTSVVTDSTGFFLFTNLVAGAYTVVPLNLGVGFTPAKRDLTLDLGSVTSVDFTANASRLQSGGFTNLQFRLSVTGLPQRNYVIEASTNITAWEAIATNATDNLGVFNFIDGGTTNVPQRFYRSRSR